MKDKNKDTYSWWEDPRNKERVEKLSWWDHPENQDKLELPISIVESEGWWVASVNDRTTALLGDGVTGCAQGRTREEAVKKLLMMRFGREHLEEESRNYRRWVPFRMGDWKRLGGRWLVVFGIHFNFRNGKGMKGGNYIPLTNLNVSVSSDWAGYRRWKQERDSSKNIKKDGNGNG